MTSLSAFIINPREEPRLDERLELKLLELIARATAAGRSVDAAALVPPDCRPDDVSRQLRAIRSVGLIDYINTKHLQGDAMLIQGLTPCGWRRLEELRQRHTRPARWALARSWPAAERWIVPLLAALVGALAGTWLASG